MPVTPLPDGSGIVTTGTLGPQNTTAWSFASSYQRTFSDRVFNELRIGDTRRSVGRTAADLDAPPSASLGLPGIPSNAQFPEHAADVPHRRLSAAGIAAEHGVRLQHERDARSPTTLTWLKGRHTLKMGGDLRWERLNVIQPPSPTGSFTFSNLFTDLPGVANTGTPLRELPARSGAAVLDRPAAGADSEPRAFPGVLHPGRLEAHATA